MGSRKYHICAHALKLFITWTQAKEYFFAAIQITESVEARSIGVPGIATARLESSFDLAK